MDRSDVINLVSYTYTVDAIGQRVPVETKTEVFCDVQSISRSEFYDAGKIGLTPEYKVTMFAPEYGGETVVEYNNKLYGVYRTYEGRNDTMELYLARKEGVTSGNVQS